MSASEGVYALRPRLRSRLLAAFFPNRARSVPTFVALILMIGPGGWLGLVGFAYLVVATYRGFRVGLRADARGIQVRNVLRSRTIAWSEIAAIRSPRQAIVAEPLTLRIDVGGGVLRRLWSGASVEATLGIGKDVRRRVALELAAVGRTYGHGIPAGTEEDIAAQLQAGLFENRDPEAHAAWWESNAGQPDGDDSAAQRS